MVNWLRTRKHDGFPRKVEDAHSFIEEIKKQNCPSCGQKKLYPLTTEMGVKKDWETKIRCNQCGSIGIFNNTGYQMELVYHKVEEPKK